MQYHILFAATMAATASALHIPRQAQQATFSVSNLAIGKDSTSNVIEASLQVTGSGTGQSLAKCSSNTVTGGDAEICPVGNIAWDGFVPAECLTDNSFAWSITPVKTPTAPPQQAWSLQINYTEPDGTILTGCYLLQEDEFLCDIAPVSPGSPQEYGIRYQGATSFDVNASSASNTCLYV